MKRHSDGWGARAGAVLLVILLALLAACGEASSTPAPAGGGAGGAATAAPTATTAPRATTGVATTGAAAPSPAQAGTKRQVKLGVAISLTGDAQVYGTTQRNGVQLAVEEINGGNLIPGVELVPVIEDDGSKKDQGITVFEKLIRTDNVIAIVGPTLSNTAVSADPIAQQAGVPVLAVSNTVGGIVEIGDFIFRDSLSEAQVIPTTIKTAKEKLGLKRVAIIYGNDDAFTKSGYDVFQKALQDNGIEIASTQTYAKGDTNFAAQLTAIRGSNPDAVIVSALANEGTQIVVQARQLGLTKPIIGGNGLNSPAIIKNAGQASEGVIVGAAWNSANDAPENKRFIESYKAKFANAEPDQFAAQAYAGIYILAEALRIAGPNADRATLRDAMTRVKNVPTVLGPFSFKENRDGDHPPVVQIVKDGKFDILK